MLVDLVHYFGEATESVLIISTRGSPHILACFQLIRPVVCFELDLMLTLNSWPFGWARFMGLVIAFPLSSVDWGQFRGNQGRAVFGR